MEQTNTITIGLTEDELELGPHTDWKTNPERFDFYKIGDATSRYRIGPDGEFHLVTRPYDWDK